MRRTAFLMFTMGLMVALAFTTMGCGGGGAGRQSLPGENPTGPITGTGTGTGSSTGTSTGTSTATSTGTGTGTGTQTGADLLAQGWHEMRTGNWFAAISRFEAVLALTTATPSERDQANNGLGWAYTRASGLEAGFTFFSAASANVGESKVGLAAALIHRGQISGVDQAISLLEAENIGISSFVYTPPHPIGVSSPEAHALLAYAYFWRNNAGDDQKAREQITAARAVDRSANTSVGQIYAVLLNMGLTGISGL